MRSPRPDLALARILAALEVGLIAATDDEIMAAAKDLGMNPAMKGSAVFVDLHYLMAPHQFRVDRWGSAAGDQADAEENGSPAARLDAKPDAPRSR